MGRYVKAEREKFNHDVFKVFEEYMMGKDRTFAAANKHCRRLGEGENFKRWIDILIRNGSINRNEDTLIFERKVK